MTWEDIFYLAGYVILVYVAWMIYLYIEDKILKMGD